MAEKQRKPKPLHLAKLHVHKGDTVGICRQGRGKEGKVLRAMPRENKVIVEGAEHRQEAREARSRHHAGGHHREADAVACLERDGRNAPSAGSRPVSRTSAFQWAHDQKVRTRRVCKKCGKPMSRNIQGCLQPVASSGTHHRAEPRLQERYQQEVVPALQKEFAYDNLMQVPAGLHKVVINIGMGEAIQNPKAMDAAVRDLTTITGQKPVHHEGQEVRRGVQAARGHAIGVMVTLRGERMYDFLDRLMNVALPRLRDFQGVSPDSFDGRGNYTLGLQGATGLPGDRVRQD